MEHIIMSKKEREQLIVFKKLETKEITQREAALRLNISTRWVRKKYKRFKQNGDAGLIHQNRGKKSEKRWNEIEKTLALELLRSEWMGFGPTFASEKLLELHGIKISKETLRTEMIKNNLWMAKVSKKLHRQRRNRRSMIGLMIQLDGSPHDWLESRGPKCTLLVFIDDATSKILWLEFVKCESNIEVIRATKNYIKANGIPHEFYVDFGRVFSINKGNKERIKKTQWERIVESIGSAVHHAHSPQAKGRVERANETFQDRLVKELRLARACSIDEANRFLRESDYISNHNEKFAVPALLEGDAHRPTDFSDLDNIFCLTNSRILLNDFTILFEKRIFQLTKQQRTIVRPKDIITIKTSLDGAIKLFIRQTELSFFEVKERIKQERKKNVPALLKPTPLNSKRWVYGLAPIYPQPGCSSNKLAGAAMSPSLAGNEAEDSHSNLVINK